MLCGGTAGQEDCTRQRRFESGVKKKKFLFSFGPCLGLHISFSKSIAPQNSRSHSPRPRGLYVPNASRPEPLAAGDAAAAAGRRGGPAGHGSRYVHALLKPGAGECDPSPGETGRGLRRGRTPLRLLSSGSASRAPSQECVSDGTNFGVHFPRNLSSAPPGDARECQERGKRTGFQESGELRMTQTPLTGSRPPCGSPRSSSRPGCESRICASRSERRWASDLQGGTWLPWRACHTRPSFGRRGPGGVRQGGWGQGGCGRRAGEQFPAVLLAGNVFDLRAIAAREGGAPEGGRRSPGGAWSSAVASSGFPDSWHLLLQRVR